MLKKCDGRTDERTDEQTDLCIELRYAQLIIGKGRFHLLFLVLLVEFSTKAGPPQVTHSQATKSGHQG